MEREQLESKHESNVARERLDSNYESKVARERLKANVARKQIESNTSRLSHVNNANRNTIRMWRMNGSDQPSAADNVCSKVCPWALKLRDDDKQHHAAEKKIKWQWRNRNIQQPVLHVHLRFVVDALTANNLLQTTRSGSGEVCKPLGLGRQQNQHYNAVLLHHAAQCHRPSSLDPDRPMLECLQ